MAAALLAAACASSPPQPTCEPPASEALSYAAERRAFVRFTGALTAEDQCWLARRGVRIVRLFPETGSASILLPDSFNGDLRTENPRIVEFSVQMR